MKFSLARPALALAVSLTLASCGGGSDKETYPISVTAYNVQYEGFKLATNGQVLSVPRQATGATQVTATFPKGLDYGEFYEVVPSGGAIDRNTGKLVTLGAQPAHQTCEPTLGAPRWYGTAGQTASINDAHKPAIEIFYSCSVNTFGISGSINGLTKGVLTLTNGSDGAVSIDSAAITGGASPFVLPAVPYGSTYGVTVVEPQPTGLKCTVANGVGKIDEAVEANKGVTGVTVTCVPAS